MIVAVADAETSAAVVASTLAVFDTGTPFEGQSAGSVGGTVSEICTE